MPETQTNSRTRIILIVYVVLCAMVFIVHGFRLEPNVYFSYDFMDPYSGARCMVQNCNSYDTVNLRSVFIAAGGDKNIIAPFQPYFANYPPTTFLLLMPIALLPWKAAHLLWMLIVSVAYSAAALCMTEISLSFDISTRPLWSSRPIWATLLLGANLASATLMIVAGQVSSVSIPFAIIGAWFLMRQKHRLPGVIFLSLSLLLKPQIAPGFWLYFLLTSKYRRSALQVAALYLVVAISAVIWISLVPANHGWWAELHMNIVKVAQHGVDSDPGPANAESFNFLHLQTLLAFLYDQPTFYNPAALLLTLSLFGVWLFNVLRQSQSITRDLYALATIGAISLLPVYHRAYDLGIVLLLVPPAIASVSRRMDTIAALLLALIAMFSFLTPANTKYILWINHHNLKIWDSSHIVRYIVFSRSLPLLLLSMVCLLLLTLSRMRLAAGSDVSGERVCLYK